MHIIAIKKINDNLTVSFAHYVGKFKSEAGVNAKEKIFDEKLEINDDAQNAAFVLRFFDDEKISDKESFGSIRKRARNFVKKGRFNVVADYLLGLLFDFQETKWNEITKLKKKITANIRPIFKALEFSVDNNQKDLLLAISFLKTIFHYLKTTEKILLKMHQLNAYQTI